MLSFVLLTCTKLNERTPNAPELFRCDERMVVVQKSSGTTKENDDCTNAEQRRKISSAFSTHEMTNEVSWKRGSFFYLFRFGSAPRSDGRGCFVLLSEMLPSWLWLLFQFSTWWNFAPLCSGDHLFFFSFFMFWVLLTGSWFAVCCASDCGFGLSSLYLALKQ